MKKVLPALILLTVAACAQTPQELITRYDMNARRSALRAFSVEPEELSAKQHV